MKRIFLFVGILSVVLCPVWAVTSPDEGVIGMSVIKDAENTADYTHSRFVENPISTIHLNRYTGESEILHFLNITSVGKQIVNYLLDYTLGKMDTRLLLERMPKGHAANPQDEDWQAVFQNNYILVIQYDEESRDKAKILDTLSFRPTGHWYLYQLQCDNDIYGQLRENMIRPSDDMATQGEKRSNYEGISVPVELVDNGDNIGPGLMSYLVRNIKYVSAEDIKSGKQKRQLGKTSTALKIALSPVLILKK